MIGVIELVLVVIAIGVFCSIVFASTITSSRVDWSKVLLVFLGIPFLLILALGGTYFLSQSRAQHEVALAQAEQRIAQDAAASERERALRALDEISVTEQVTAIPGESNSENDHESHVIYSAQHEMPSNIGRVTEMAAQPTLFLLVLGGAVVIGLFVLLFSLMNRKTALLLTFTSLGVVLFAFGFLTIKVDTIEYPAQQQTASSTSVLPPQELPTYLEDPAGSIPVGEDENEADATSKPLQILERDYDFSNGTSISSKSVNRIPNWVEEALTEHVFRPDENEIVITSKRYSSIKEAEAELNKIAEMLVTDYVVGIYPEMRESWIDAEQIRRLGILEKSCEITWPFQVGEFKDKVYQVTWQLDVTSRIQHDLHDKWQRNSISQRLVYLGGGFGLVTLIFGIGAIVTRGKEQEDA